jgi:hypothetical protein
MDIPSPGSDKESNWLPAPASGSFTMNLRLYWPKSMPLRYRHHGHREKMISAPLNKCVVVKFCVKRKKGMFSFGP